MASGHIHDHSTILLGLPFGMVSAILLGWTPGLIAALAFLWGGLWFSPDLDTRSNALRRWGPLRFLWWPYRCLIPHRSIWSHGPLIGTTLRLMYVLVWMLIAVNVIPELSHPQLFQTIQTWMEQQPRQVLALLIGLEASVWLHLIQDGDPLPKEWHRRRRQ